jgi:hypothetical protein
MKAGENGCVFKENNRIQLFFPKQVQSESGYTTVGNSFKQFPASGHLQNK